jgi:hypothetical protein
MKMKKSVVLDVCPLAVADVKLTDMGSWVLNYFQAFGKSPALLRKIQLLQNMKFLNFYFFAGILFLTASRSTLLVCYLVLKLDK